MSKNSALPTTVERYFRPGQYLFREADPSKSMFIIKKGTVAIRKRKGTAHVEIARIYSNEVLGEISFFDRLPRSASAVALTEVQVLEIQFDSLDKIYEGVPDYMKTIIASVADRLRKANDMIRRLQKNLVFDEDGSGKPDGVEASAADILAATAGIGSEIPESNETSIPKDSDED
jgi:CRP-like cAMP-binding protein